MKKRFCIIPFIAAVLLSACQSTPSDEMVIGKELNKMIQMATEQPTSAEQTSLEEQTNTPAAKKGQSALARKLGAPEHYTDNFTDPKGTLKVSVDAEVDIPECEKIKILQVEKSKFTQEDADALIKELVHGQLLKCDESGELYTRDSIMQKIIALKGELAKGLPDGEDPEWEKCTKNEISVYEKLYKSAPKDPVPISGRFEHQVYTNADGTEFVAKKEELIGGIATKNGYETLYMRNHDEGMSFMWFVREPKAPISLSGGIGLYYPVSGANNTTGQKGEQTSVYAAMDSAGSRDIALSKEDAIKQANELLKKTGIDSLSCSRMEKVYGGSNDTVSGASGVTNPYRYAWRLIYLRNVDGLPTNYTNIGCNSSEDDYAPYWEYESITFYIDDSGIVGFEWISPYKVKDTKVENANVMPFNKIKGIFKKMIAAKNAWFTSGSDANVEITKIQFGLTRIFQKDKPNTGLLIPVWDFFGTITKQYDLDGQARTSTLADPDRSLLTINAIDGSVIDRSLGY